MFNCVLEDAATARNLTNEDADPEQTSSVNSGSVARSLFIEMNF
jgi:hypothetical protein